MVTRHPTTPRCPANARSRTQQGALATECVIAMSILAVVMLPLAFSFLQETKLLRVYYYRAIALEIIDGEMEKLAAGEWRAFPQGRHPYAVQAGSATNLPNGSFLLTLENGVARLEWIPSARHTGGRVIREVKLR